MWSAFYELISNMLFIIEYLYGDTIVNISANGSIILGSKFYTVFDQTPYVAFWKIPFAEPPVGILRFKPPIPVHWLDQRTYNYTAPYEETCSNSLTEDCLYLSLFMPYRTLETSFAVMVWLHEDSNYHGPDFLIDENVIVCTVSYRNSILGFLNTGDDFARGNMGAKDVLLALEWIRHNIVYFNGDPNRVTVIGSGTAANLVASFLVSPLAKDLFSRVIVQSGSALSPADYRFYSFEVLNKLYWNFYGAFERLNRTRFYERLTNATVRELASRSQDMFDSTEVRDDQRLINAFGLSVETGKRSFLDELPLNKYKAGLMANGVTVMMGFNNLESMHKLSPFVNNEKLLKYMNFNFQYLLPFEGRKDEYESRQYKEIRRKIMDFYFVNGTIGERSLRRYAKYLSDQVIYPVLRQARLHSKTSRNHVYMYRFTFLGHLNVVWRSSLRNLRLKGATKGDEICYQFKCKSIDSLYNSDVVSPERYFAKRIARLLANFAKYGDPTPTNQDEILGYLKWDPLISNKSLRGMNLGRKLKMINLPEEKRSQFWDQLNKDYFEEDEHIIE